jgi:hypothetical protein
MMAKRASSKMLRLGEKIALKILFAPEIPSELNKSTIDIFVITQPAIKVRSKIIQLEISTIHFEKGVFLAKPNNFAEIEVLLMVQRTPRNALIRNTISICSQEKGISLKFRKSL